MVSKPIPDRLVVLTFDDGNKTDIAYVAPLLQEYGFGATFFITEGLSFLDNKARRLTWDEVRELHALGFEIGNHTRNHARADTQSKGAFLADLEHIEACCVEHGIPKPQSFCYPGYHHGPEVVAVLMEKGYRFARRGVAPEYPVALGRERAYDPEFDHPLLVPATGAPGPDWTFEDFVEAVEQARDGRVAVLTYHGVPDLDHPWVHTDPDFFRDCMQYLYDNGYTVVALRDLAQYVDPAAYTPDPYASMRKVTGGADQRRRNVRRTFGVHR